MVTNAYDDIKAEREYQTSRGWKDECNNSFAWVCYIVNYVSRFSMPVSFDAAKYNFRTCMVKAAALCVAAIEWYDRNQPTDCVEVPKNVTP